MRVSDPPEVVQRRIVEDLTRKLSADDVFFYNDADDEALLDCTDIERREKEKKDIQRNQK